uniref:Uncharacterized protein n=1 Tax=Anser brachyrhynchus TaxID=132585 RepID=A0A8B9CW72_9AVES
MLQWTRVSKGISVFWGNATLGGRLSHLLEGHNVTQVLPLEPPAAWERRRDAVGNYLTSFSELVWFFSKERPINCERHGGGARGCWGAANGAVQTWCMEGSSVLGAARAVMIPCPSSWPPFPSSRPPPASRRHAEPVLPPGLLPLPQRHSPQLLRGLPQRDGLPHLPRPHRHLGAPLARQGRGGLLCPAGADEVPADHPRPAAFPQHHLRGHPAGSEHRDRSVPGMTGVAGDCPPAPSACPLRAGGRGGLPLSPPLTSCRKAEQPVARPAGAGSDPGGLGGGGHGRRHLLVHRWQLLAEATAVPRHPTEAGNRPSVTPQRQGTDPVHCKPLAGGSRGWDVPSLPHRQSPCCVPRLNATPRLAGMEKTGKGSGEKSEKKAKKALKGWHSNHHCPHSGGGGELGRKGGTPGRGPAGGHPPPRTTALLRFWCNKTPPAHRLVLPSLALGLDGAPRACSASGEACGARAT